MYHESNLAIDLPEGENVFEVIDPALEGVRVKIVTGLVGKAASDVIWGDDPVGFAESENEFPVHE